MGKFRNAIIKIRYKYNQWRERKKLRFTDFSIISNNCWAGTAVYQPFGLKYNTPTVGLFIMDEDYIQMLERLDYYMKQTPQFISPEESKYYDKISEGGKKAVTYPIATIGGDVELHFLHYHSKEEALTKWKRRVERINYDRLLIKMSLRDSGYDIEEMQKRFTSLPFRNKICFSPSESRDKCIITVPELETLNLVGGDETDYTLLHIDIITILNKIN